MIALGLAIFGATDEASPNTSDIQKGKTIMKSAIIIFLMIYLLVFALVVITMKDVGTAPRGEKRIYLAVLGALPLLAVRLLYSILAAFTNNEDFSIFDGKPLIKLFMAIAEEFIIVCFYTLVGLTANEVQVRRNGHRRREGHVRRELQGRRLNVGR
jgi:hypothetical protein